MQKNKKIFDKRFLCTAGVIAILLSPLGGSAATSNGCDESMDNEYINPELALCSTHVYNIGDTENPKTDGERQMMRDVVALKTTIMTQQMYKQYEYLESMIKRFKTQLEKAVLTTKLQAVGADTTESSSSSSGGIGSFKSSDRNIFIAGVSNCNNELTNQKVFECLNTNLNSIYNASNNGQNITIELRKQLANDYAVAVNSCDGCTADKDCKDPKNISQRKAFRDCLDGLRGLVRTGYEKSTTSQQKQNMQNWGNQPG